MKTSEMHSHWYRKLVFDFILFSEGRSYFLAPGATNNPVMPVESETSTPAETPNGEGFDLLFMGADQGEDHQWTHADGGQGITIL